MSFKLFTSLNLGRMLLHTYIEYWFVHIWITYVFLLCPPMIKLCTLLTGQTHMTYNAYRDT